MKKELERVEGKEKGEVQEQGKGQGKGQGRGQGKGQEQGEEDQLTCRGAAALGNFLKNPLVSRAFITIGIITMPGMAMPTLERVTRPGSPTC